MKNLILILIALVTILNQQWIFAQKPIPVYDVSKYCLMSVYTDGQFKSAEDGYQLVEPNTSYKLYNIDGYIKTITGYEAIQAEYPCDWNYEINFDDPYIYNYQGAIAIGSLHDAFPKKMQKQTGNNETYKNFVREILVSNGLENPVINITQLYRTDIEGDGVDEVLICATYLHEGLGPWANKGDYSIIIYRNVLNGVVENIVIDSYICRETREGEINGEFGIVAVLDVNNDGMCEIFIENSYYEGSETMIYTFDELEYPVMVAGCGCGV